MIDLLDSFAEERILHPTLSISACIGDITEFPGDAIVNAANNSLLGGGGVDGAIHWAAGHELFEECKTLGGCRTGYAKITKGYKLPAKHVIHTVGPIYGNNQEKQAEQLANCYRRSLDIAMENGIHSIAFPCISTGIYSYPHEEAATIATKTVEEWFKNHTDYKLNVVFVCFLRTDYTYYTQLIG
jgi:O-acetyl-ADP-ribose deacetylase (regulator of RNase III)